MLTILLMFLISIWTNISRRKHDLSVSPVIIVQHDLDSVPNQLEPISYLSSDLRKLGELYLLNPKLRSTPNYTTLRNIKECRINKRRIRFQKFRKQELREQNLNNISEIPHDPANPILNSKCFKFATVNARSIRNNINLILDVVLREDLDFLIVTETWLKNTEDCKSWLNAQCLHTLGYNHDSILRPGWRKGGGLLLIYKKTLSDQAITTTIPHCETGLWKISTNNFSVTCLGVYHPPPTGPAYILDAVFTTSFADHIALLQADHQNLIISGDFNIHVNDISNDDAIFFTEAMSLLGFKQHVQAATHQKGNTLDLVFTNPEYLSLSKCVAADFISDHRIVISQTTLLNPKPNQKSVDIRKYNSSNIQLFSESLNFQKVLEADDVNVAVDHYAKELQTKLDSFIPLKTKRITEHRKVPWFTDDIKIQRQLIRNRERVWLKYNQDHQWQAYKRERNRYKRMVTHQKTCFYSGKITELKGDTKSLYLLVSNLTTHTAENPLPDGLSDSNLSEGFAD